MSPETEDRLRRLGVPPDVWSTVENSQLDTWREVALLIGRWTWLPLCAIAGMISAGLYFRTLDPNPAASRFGEIWAYSYGDASFIAAFFLGGLVGATSWRFVSVAVTGWTLEGARHLALVGSHYESRSRRHDPWPFMRAVLFGITWLFLLPLRSTANSAHYLATVSRLRAGVLTLVTLAGLASIGALLADDRARFRGMTEMGHVTVGFGTEDVAFDAWSTLDYAELDCDIRLRRRGPDIIEPELWLTFESGRKLPVDVLSARRGEPTPFARAIGVVLSTNRPLVWRQLDQLSGYTAKAPGVLRCVQLFSSELTYEQRIALREILSEPKSTQLRQQVFGPAHG